jgi:hypothetical protein
MGLIDKVKPTNQKVLDNNLELDEIEFILGMIKQSTFKGESIEPLYKIVLKLQSQYLNLKDTNE